MIDHMEEAMAHVVLLESDHLRTLIAHAAGLHADKAGVLPTVDAMGRIAMRLEQQTTHRRMAAIAWQVALRHGLTLDDLRRRSNSRAVAWPRQEAMYLMRLVERDDGTPRYSFPAIARFFGLLDHTTVIHGIEAYRARQAGGRENPPLQVAGARR